MKAIPEKLRTSPLWVGVGVVLLACLLYFSFGQQKPELLVSLDNQVVNAMFRFRGPQVHAANVVIVDIDEKSLRELGQWPWPRDVVAELVGRIDAAGALVTGFDIVFAEPDRTSPVNLLPSLSDVLTPAEMDQIERRADMDHDLMLGDAVAESQVVLGYPFQLSRDGLKREADRPMPSVNLHLEPAGLAFSALALRQGYRAVVNVPEVAMAESEGFFNIFYDPAGTVRQAPLLMLMDGIVYPSLALEMARLGQGISELVVHAGRQKSGGRNTVLGISLGARFIPTTGGGELAINYRGPYNTFTYLPAVEVLRGEHAGRIKDSYVLIGASAAGLFDVHATPYSSIYPGVEVQATIIDNLLNGDPFFYDIFTEIGITYSLILAGGILLSIMLAYMGAIAGGLLGLALIMVTIVVDYQWFFLNNRLIGITYPLLVLVTVFMVETLFNYFAEYRRKSFIRDAFGHYVPPAVISEIIREPGKLSLAGEQREVTILFSDIRDFTSISEHMDSQQLGFFMNSYLTAMSDIIMSHRGLVDKYIGDAVMAFWGAPLNDGEHVVNAVRAALAMQQKLDRMQTEFAQRGLPAIETGIGINTGTVSVGNFGSQRRFDYTVIGDDVNLASRLEGLNKPYGTRIIISGYTRNLLGPNFFCRPIDLVRVKGKEQPVEIFEPLLEGEPSEELRSEVSEFEVALRGYRARNFEAAYDRISQLQANNPSQLYALYLERIREFLKAAPAPDWDGTFNHKTK